RLPDSVHETVKALAEKDNISINQFISSAVIEKITALETEKYLSMRAERGSREKLGEVLDLVPDTEPDMIDKL
ncbi:MAG: toxin-antitoxin system HicB family antitoxin, partial [Erysipelotrichaceae bacterium]|nr:toxin-antitoxin system HicB family antitoxin [Erysipelotrichaceae bacterium]